MSSSARLTSASPLAIALGMLAIYIVWGTTYLAIRVVVDPAAGSAILRSPWSHFDLLSLAQ